MPVNGLMFQCFVIKTYISLSGRFLYAFKLNRMYGSVRDSDGAVYLVGYELKKI